MTWDTLTVDGVDLARPDRIVETFQVGATTSWRGSNYTVPGKSGTVWVEKPRDTVTIPLGVTVTCADPETGVDPSGLDAKIAQFNQNWNDLVSLVKPRRRQIALGKRISLPDGVEHEVFDAAELAGPVAQSRLNAYTARTVLNFELEDGCWFDNDISTHTLVTGANYVPVSGTTDTSSLKVDLLVSAAGTQTLTNESTGVSFSYVWTASRVGHTVTVDAANFTVRRFDGVSLFTSLSPFSHAGDARFMVLDPDAGEGTNELTLNMGTATLSYRGAWL